MSQQMCRECHRLVSEAASTCPHCGMPRPVAADGPFTHLRPCGSALLLGLALVWIGGLWFRYQVGQLKEIAATPTTIAIQDKHPAYQTLDQGVWLGAPLLRRNSLGYVGRITSLDCPQPAAAASRVACLQIEFVDGRRDWIQWSTAETQYVTLPR